MIPAILAPRQADNRAPAAWQAELAQALSGTGALLDYLGLDPAPPALDAARVKDFPLRVPRGYAARMRRGDPQDPLFLQVWPSPREAELVPGFGGDAVGDLPAARGDGIVHKYAGRALLIATGACAVHCRYCFRREFPYGDHVAAKDRWRGALAQIAADTSLSEVILSGGDPLSLTDDKLAFLAEALEFIPHVRRLRIHTRTPVVLPERVDDALLAWLGRGRVRRVMVVHANHPNEINAEVAAAFGRLRTAGVALLNQSVLLAGINDSTETLRKLSEALFDAGVLPYYLHQLDRVSGVHHYEVPEDRAKSLHRQLHQVMPGYLVPKLVKEQAGQPAKTVISW